MTDVYLTARHGTNKLQCKTLYATLHDASTGHILVSATMRYVLQVIEEREYNVIDKGK